jgi:16S rRNA processing protein RimM
LTDKTTGEFRAAVIGRPVGLKGFVKLKSLSGEYDHLAALKTMRLRLKGADSVRQVDDFDSENRLVKFDGIDTPEAAKALTGGEVVIERKDGAPTGADEYYIEDLKGLAVTGADGRYGFVADVVEGGGGFLLEVEKVDGKRVFVPFRKEFFGQVDVDAGLVELLAPWALD